MLRFGIIDSVFRKLLKYQCRAERGVERQFWVRHWKFMRIVELLKALKAFKILKS
jgi:hypothetical protein